MRRLAPLLAVLVLALGGLTACGGDDSAGGSTGPKKIDITFSGDSVTPNGEKVEVSVGQKIVLHVKADAPGEIHVHSTPEQELEYDQGTTDLTLTIDRPGLVDVESHALEKTILQLQVQ
jgi:ABC-type glycerol-3-phosphate transport system substrate-binding protein